MSFQPTVCSVVLYPEYIFNFNNNRVHTWLFISVFPWLLAYQTTAILNFPSQARLGPSNSLSDRASPSFHAAKWGLAFMVQYLVSNKSRDSKINDAKVDQSKKIGIDRVLWGLVVSGKLAVVYYNRNQVACFSVSEKKWTGTSFPAFPLLSVALQIQKKILKKKVDIIVTAVKDRKRGRSFLLGCPETFDWNCSSRSRTAPSQVFSKNILEIAWKLCSHIIFSSVTFVTLKKARKTFAEFLIHPCVQQRVGGAINVDHNITECEELRYMRILGPTPKIIPHPNHLIGQ